MKSSIILFSLTFLALQLASQYSNGSFLSSRDFTEEDTRSYQYPPIDLSGIWTATGELEFNFQQVGNAYLATVESYSPNYPLFEKDEVIAVISYTGNGIYQFAIRTKMNDGSESIAKTHLSYQNNSFSDRDGNYNIQRVAEAPVYSSASNVSGPNRVSGSRELKKKSAIPSMMTVPPIASHRANMPKASQRQAPAVANNSNSNNVNRYRQSSYAQNNNTAQNGNYNGYNQHSSNSYASQSVTYFKEDNSSKGKKKKKGGFGKFLKGAGNIVKGAVNIYAGSSGVMNVIGGKAIGGSGDALSSLVGMVAKSNSGGGNSDILKSLSGLVGGDEKELLKGITALAGGNSKNNSSEELVEVISKLLASKDQQRNSQSNSYNDYARQSSDKFQKDYGHILDLLNN